MQPWFLKAEHNERGANAWHAEGGPLNVADLQQPNPLSLDFVEAGVQTGYARNTDFNGLQQEGVGLSPSRIWHMARGIWQWRRQRSGILTTNFAEGGAFLRSSPQEARPDLQLHFVVAKLIEHGRSTV